MKIVGGKYIPGTQGQIGAYVATIYPGGVADQLHGELQEVSHYYALTFCVSIRMSLDQLNGSY